MLCKLLTGTVVGLLFLLAGPDCAFSQSESKDRQQDQKQLGEEEEQEKDDDDLGIEGLSKAKQRSMMDLGAGAGRRPGNNAPRAGTRGTRRSSSGDGETQTVKDRQGRRTIVMRVDEKDGILVEVAVDYGPNDKAELIRKHPELGDYVELFPKQVGEHQIELSMKIRSQYRARTSDELQEKYPDAFNLMRRYYKKKRR